MDLPLAPEHLNNRLCTTLFNKSDYTIHYNIMYLCYIMLYVHIMN